VRFYRMKRTLAFTLTELLVVIAIIAIIAAILFPVFAQGHNKSKAITCLSNTKQISLGILMYLQDYDEKMPHRDQYQELVYPYLKNDCVYRCPKIKGSPENQGYALESRLIGKELYKIKNIGKTPMLWDSWNLEKNAIDSGISFAARHNGFGNIAFVDGHARSYRDDKGHALIFAPIVFEKNK
jgi:prepilin-type N-terminal cleavage/methylation domain-containing protein/prepilin-type processing-associated H-X9-DG protein